MTDATGWKSPAWWSKKAPAPKIRQVQGGSDYEDVSSRVTRYRHDHPFGAIMTVIENLDDNRVKAYAEVWSDPSVTGSEAIRLGSGHAFEVRSQRGVNSTSCEENAETSAVGRALAFAGYDSTGSVASAEEVERAIAQQQDTRKPAARSSSPKAATASVSSRSGAKAQEPSQPRPTPVTETGDYYGDPGRTGTERGRDHFIVTQVEIFKEGERNGKSWRIWNINCACGTSFSTFSDEYADIAKDSLQADGDVEIAWTRDQGFPKIHEDWQTRKLVIEGVSAGEHDGIKIIDRPAQDNLAQEMMEQIAAQEAEDGLPI